MCSHNTHCLQKVPLEGEELELTLAVSKHGRQDSKTKIMNFKSCVQLTLEHINLSGTVLQQCLPGSVLLLESAPKSIWDPDLVVVLLQGLITHFTFNRHRGSERNPELPFPVKSEQTSPLVLLHSKPMKIVPPLLTIRVKTSPSEVSNHRHNTKGKIHLALRKTLITTPLLKSMTPVRAPALP